MRIYVDKQDGVNLDDCACISAQVSALLDVEDLIKSKYNLEVSSPGIDRQLFKLEHYSRYVGSKVRLQLLQPIEGKRKFVGIIQDVANDNVVILINNEVMNVAVENIAKAHIVL